MNNQELDVVDVDEVQNRRNLGNELEGLGGLVYRIAMTQDPVGMHSAAIALVCEAIYLARKVMLEDKLEEHDLDDVMGAISDLEKKALDWKVRGLRQQVWDALPERLKPETGPSRSAVEFALYEWLAKDNMSGKENAKPAELATQFAEFLEGSQKPTRVPRRRHR